MANTLAPFGFKWHGIYGDSVPPTSGLIQMKIASTDTVTAGENDPLKFVAATSGYVSLFTKGTTTGVAGIFKSCSYFSTVLGRKVWSNYWPGSGATGDVIVNAAACNGAPAPRFLVQSSGTLAVTMGNMWNNVDVTYSAGGLGGAASTAGNIVGGYYRSPAMIDLTATIAQTNTLPFRIVGLWSDIAAPGSAGADTASAYNWVLVETNNAQFVGR
jgi:hypothetical protein